METSGLRTRDTKIGELSPFLYISHSCFVKSLTVRLNKAIRRVLSPSHPHLQLRQDGAVPPHQYVACMGQFSSPSPSNSTCWGQILLLGWASMRSQQETGDILRQGHWGGCFAVTATSSPPILQDSTGHFWAPGCFSR